MDIDPASKEFRVSSREPFGRILIEYMRRKSKNASVLDVQYRVGKILLNSYFESEIESVERQGLASDKAILNQNVARDISIKTMIHARSADITMTFTQQYFDGLEQIAIAKSKNIEMLHAEREVVSVAAGMEYEDENGILTDDQDLLLIDEEIAEAESAVEALDLIRNYFAQ